MFRRQPIARQVMVLVAAAVLATAGAMIAITLIGPPPRPAPTQLSDIVRGLRGEPAGGADGRPLRLGQAESPPAPQASERRDPGLERWIAAELGTSPENVRAYTTENHPSGEPGRPRRELRGEGSFGWWDAGQWRIVHIDPGPTARHWWATVSLVTVLVLGAIIGLAARSARAITRPLEHLAAHIGGQREHLDMSNMSDGPPEIEVVAGALTAFRRAQLDHVAQRTRMLSAIAHDLGTPLTRLAFRLEALPEPQRDAAQAEITAMRRLIEDSLALDRSVSEPESRFDLADLLIGMIDECRMLGQPVAHGPIESSPIIASQLALRRLIQNLIDNALRYGKGATLHLSRVNGTALLAVRDRGPGFSPEMLVHGCRPFVRGEASRNSATGGSGLGLAIAATIARQHRGTLELRNGARGGEVILHLPLAPKASPR